MCHCWARVSKTSHMMEGDHYYQWTSATPEEHRRCQLQDNWSLGNCFFKQNTVALVAVEISRRVVQTQIKKGGTLTCQMSPLQNYTIYIGLYSAIKHQTKYIWFNNPERFTINNLTSLAKVRNARTQQNPNALYIYLFLLTKTSSGRLCAVLHIGYRYPYLPKHHDATFDAYNNIIEHLPTDLKKIAYNLTSHFVLATFQTI